MLRINCGTSSSNDKHDDSNKSNNILTSLVGKARGSGASITSGVQLLKKQHGCKCAGAKVLLLLKTHVIEVLICLGLRSASIRSHCRVD